MNRGKTEGKFQLNGKTGGCGAFRHVKASNGISARVQALVALLLLYFASSVRAAAVAGEAIPASGSVLQVMLGLVVVLAIMAGAAWLLMRFGPIQRDSGGAVKVIGASAIGQRERVVLVEVENTWLVIGVAPGHVTALHTMPKGKVSGGVANLHPAERNLSFSAWLKRLTEKRNEQRAG